VVEWPLIVAVQIVGEPPKSLSAICWDLGTVQRPSLASDGVSLMIGWPRLSVGPLPVLT
jgi:hypothetical protein